MSKTLVHSTRRPATQVRGDVTRARLLECAHALFLKQGFHATSMRDIAEAAGIAVGGIYNHYRDKEEVFAAVLDAYHPYHVVLPALENTKGETVEEFVRDAAEHVRMGFEGAEDRLVPLVFIELVEFQGRHFKRMATRLLPALLGFFARFSQQRGKLRRLPRPVMLRAFMSLLGGYLLSEVILKDTPFLAHGHYDWFGGMLEIYLHGILVAEA